jgi:hypothetical protein
VGGGGGVSIAAIVLSTLRKIAHQKMSSLADGGGVCLGGGGVTFSIEQIKFIIGALVPGQPCSEAGRAKSRWSYEVRVPDPDSVGSVDPDSDRDWESGYGSGQVKIVPKKWKKLRNFHV